jgi:hypothetical protein
MTSLDVSPVISRHCTFQDAQASAGGRILEGPAPAHHAHRNRYSTSVASVEVRLCFGYRVCYPRHPSQKASRGTETGLPIFVSGQWEAAQATAPSRLLARSSAHHTAVLRKQNHLAIALHLRASKTAWYPAVPTTLHSRVSVGAWSHCSFAQAKPPGDCTALPR